MSATRIQRELKTRTGQGEPRSLLRRRLAVTSRSTEHGVKIPYSRPVISTEPASGEQGLGYSGGRLIQGRLQLQVGSLLVPPLNPKQVRWQLEIDQGSVSEAPEMKLAHTLNRLGRRSWHCLHMMSQVLGFTVGGAWQVGLGDRSRVIIRLLQPMGGLFVM